jgi:glycine/D-amino acid oxidase-like deaminating enzyme
VVIGAGILGASVAARLAEASAVAEAEAGAGAGAEAGMRVTLLDQAQPGRATTRWSFAWLNSNDKPPRHYHDLNHAGVRAWAELAPDLDGPAWYRPAGNLELATDDGELAARVRRLTAWDYPARLIDPAEATRLEPSLQPPAPGTAAAWFPGEAYLLTEPLIERLVSRAAAHGATILTGDQGRVTSLAPGRISTADGAEIEADDIVCCAGRWTPDLAAQASQASRASPASPGNLIPLVDWETPGATAPGLVVRVGPIGAEGPKRLIHTPRLALRPHSGGLLHLEAPDAAVDLHTPDTELRSWAAELLDRAQATVRGLDHATVVDYQVCVRPMPTDGQSIVGRLPGAEHIYVAVTHSGVTLAAHLSRLIAAELAAGTEAAELAPYRPARFPRMAASKEGAQA